MNTTVIFTFLRAATASSIPVPIAKPWYGAATPQAAEEQRARLKMDHAGLKTRYKCFGSVGFSCTSAQPRHGKWPRTQKGSVWGTLGMQMQWVIWVVGASGCCGVSFSLSNTHLLPLLHLLLPAFPPFPLTFPSINYSSTSSIHHQAPANKMHVNTSFLQGRRHLWCMSLNKQIRGG